MKRIAKRDAQKKYPNAFKGVGGCDPMVLEPGARYYVLARQLHLTVFNTTFRWNGREKCWDEVLTSGS